MHQVYSRNIKVKRNKKRAFLLEKEIIKPLLISILAAIFTLFINSINNYDRANLDEFHKLVNDVREISYVNEFIYDSCKLEKPINQHDVKNNLFELRDKLGQLINLYKGMGHLITRDTYCSLLAFSIYNDNLQAADDKICRMPIKTNAEITQWRENVISKIIENQNLRHGILQGFIQYYFKLRDKEYTINDCQLKTHY